MKRIFACILALMLCAGLPAASAGETSGLRITLEELTANNGEPESIRQAVKDLAKALNDINMSLQAS